MSDLPTIFALSSGAPPAGVGVIRVSGPQAGVALAALAGRVPDARRASLARAQAVKAALVAGGLPATRVDLRPLGRLAEAADRVDVLPPGVASPTTEARGR